jgi:hypothetical protein
MTVRLIRTTHLVLSDRWLLASCSSSKSQYRELAFGGHYLCSANERNNSFLATEFQCQINKSREVRL